MKTAKTLKSKIEIGMLMSQVDRLCTKRFVQNSHKAGLDISQDQWMVLGPIWKNKAISQKEIAEYLDLSRPYVSTLVKNGVLPQAKGKRRHE